MYSYNRQAGAKIIPFKTKEQAQDDAYDRLHDQLEEARISAKAAKKGMEGVAKDLRDVFNKVQSIHMILNRLKHRAEKGGHLEDVRILEQISLDMSRLETPALERFQAQEAATFAVLLGGLAEGMTFK